MDVELAVVDDDVRTADVGERVRRDLVHMLRAELPRARGDDADAARAACIAPLVIVSAKANVWNWVPVLDVLVHYVVGVEHEVAASCAGQPTHATVMREVEPDAVEFGAPMPPGGGARVGVADDGVFVLTQSICDAFLSARARANMCRRAAHHDEPIRLEREWDRDDLIPARGLRVRIRGHDLGRLVVVTLNCVAVEHDVEFGAERVAFHRDLLPVVAPALEQPALRFRRHIFAAVVEQDFAPDGTIFALPLYIDTLALFYNQDVFDNKSISLPPTTWKDFENIVPRLRVLDKLGRIEKPAAAIGGTNKSINRATDLLNLVMLQSGTKMVADDFSQAAFNSDEGRESLNFYTKFANPTNPLHTWNDSLAYSLDSFAAGETAMMFNYSHQIAFLKEKNPFLNFRVAPMLQPEKRTQDVNFSNYWGIAASSKTPYRFAAQDFILFMTTDPAVSRGYLQLTGKPPALRGLINEYLNNQELGVFAKQALTARSWPQIDNVAVENILNGMVEDVISGRTPAEKALLEAQNEVSQLMRR